MKRIILALMVLVGIAAVSYAGYFWAATRHERMMLCQADGPMQWLRQEFHLDKDQCSRIQQLHAGFAPECVRRCKALDGSRANLQRALAANEAYSPPVAEALQKYQEDEAKLASLTVQQIYTVSSVMKPEDARRYRQLMLAQAVLQSAMQPMH